jgi:AAA15 family ATPase/GTPase
MITKIHIENYKIFQDFTLPLNKDLNIIVGNNETGKSTILEAINLALTKRLNGKLIEYELTPYLFNQQTEKEYLQSIQDESKKLPKILIELYLQDLPQFSKLKGTNNTCNEDVPGIKLEIIFDDDFKQEYEILVKDKKHNIKNIPSEYYKVNWFSFALSKIRNIPIKAGYIDATVIRLQSGTDYYLQDIIRNTLDNKERVGLKISYRNLKEEFSSQQPIKDLNDKLKKKKGSITDKDFSISLDISGRSNWETLLIPHLDALPVSLSGKGEQNVLKILLLLEKKTEEEADVILVEEPENHLSFTSMNKLIKKNKRQMLR